MEKLSETLKCDHECGDFGKALEGYSEIAKELENKVDVAQKVFDDLFADDIYGAYALGEDLWNEFKAAFKK